MVRCTGPHENRRACNCTDTGVYEEVPDAPYSAAEFPGGWVIVWSNDFDFASAEHLAPLSVDKVILSCQIHEGIKILGPS